MRGFSLSRISQSTSGRQKLQGRSISFPKALQDELGTHTHTRDTKQRFSNCLKIVEFSEMVVGSETNTEKVVDGLCLPAQILGFAEAEESQSCQVL